MIKDIDVKSKKGEKWKAFAPGYYLSNKGRWYSKKSKKILKQYKNDSGYYRVRIFFPCGKDKFIFTHIAVVCLFGDKNGNVLPSNGLRKNNLSVDHVSRRKNNNSKNNLEIVKHSENVTRYYCKVGKNNPVKDIPGEVIDEELFA